MPVHERDIDLLFKKPPDEFTAARRALAKSAKESDQDEVASRIAALRKPTLVVWVVNQLAREHPGEVEAVLRTVKSVREAQGRGGESLREATDERRGAITALRRRGREILAKTGRPNVDDSRIANTVLAASLDPEKAKLLSRGRLEEELTPGGFESLFVGPGRVRVEPGGARNRRALESKRAEEAASRHRATERAKLEREIAASERALGRAARKAAALEASAVKAREKADRVRAAVEAARKRVTEIRDRLRELG